jgi:hypothetical protein
MTPRAKRPHPHKPHWEKGKANKFAQAVTKGAYNPKLVSHTHNNNQQLCYQIILLNFKFNNFTITISPKEGYHT